MKKIGALARDLKGLIKPLASFVLIYVFKSLTLLVLDCRSIYKVAVCSLPNK